MNRLMIGIVRLVAFGGAAVVAWTSVELMRNMGTPHSPEGRSGVQTITSRLVESRPASTVGEETAALNQSVAAVEAHSGHMPAQEKSPPAPQQIAPMNHATPLSDGNTKGSGRQIVLDAGVDATTIIQWSRGGLCGVHWTPFDNPLGGGLVIRLEGECPLVPSLAQLAEGLRTNRDGGALVLVFPQITADVSSSPVTPRLFRDASGRPAVLAQPAP